MWIQWLQAKKGGLEHYWSYLAAQCQGPGSRADLAPGSEAVSALPSMARSYLSGLATRVPAVVDSYELYANSQYRSYRVREANRAKTPMERTDWLAIPYGDGPDGRSLPVENTPEERAPQAEGGGYGD